MMNKHIETAVKMMAMRKAFDRTNFRLIGENCSHGRFCFSSSSSSGIIWTDGDVQLDEEDSILEHEELEELFELGKVGRAEYELHEWSLFYCDPFEMTYEELIEWRRAKFDDYKPHYLRFISDEDFDRLKKIRHWQIIHASENLKSVMVKGCVPLNMSVLFNVGTKDEYEKRWLDFYQNEEDKDFVMKLRIAYHDAFLLLANKYA